MKHYIVDASVVAKWLLPETQSGRAQLLIQSSFHLRAPDLIAAEVLSVLLKRVARRELTIHESHELLQRFLSDYLDARVKVIPSRLLTENALRIANHEKRSGYDSLYLALAVQARCQLITADERLVNGLRDKSLRRHVIALADPLLELN